MLNTNGHWLVSAHDGVCHEGLAADPDSDGSWLANGATLSSPRKRQLTDAANADANQPQPDLLPCLPLPTAAEDTVSLNCGLAGDIHSADLPPAPLFAPPPRPIRHPIYL